MGVGGEQCAKCATDMVLFGDGVTGTCNVHCGKCYDRMDKLLTCDVCVVPCEPCNGLDANACKQCVGYSEVCVDNRGKHEWKGCLALACVAPEFRPSVSIFFRDVSRQLPCRW